MTESKHAAGSAEWRRMLCVWLVALSPLWAAVGRAQAPTVMSVADILGNYGLDTAIVADTAAARAWLDAQPQNFVLLTDLCVSVRTKAQRALKSIESDYDFRDSLVWLDSNTVLADYSIYEYRLRSLADFMGRMSIRYSRLEQKRAEDEREAARQRAIEALRRQQQERNRQAADLKANIELHHRAIHSACDAPGVTDKNKVKQLKDLFYSYLMVYNKYDLSEGDATEESLARLDQLNAFQNDMMENVLGENSLINQIDNFKNILKVRCEKDNADIYRSYSKVFKHTNVPVSFADVKEYEDYIVRLRTIVAVQQRYLQTIDLRQAISQGSEAIASTFGKKYRGVVSSYRDALRTVDQLPAFTSNAESIVFIQNLDAFIEAQQLYVGFYPVLEEIEQRGDSIVGQRRFPDVAQAYRNVQEQMHPLPSFKDADGAVLYEQQLADVLDVQQCFLDALDMRDEIAAADDTITASRKLDRTLANGYRLLRKQTDLAPNFATVERGRAYLSMLAGYQEMQQLCIDVISKLRQVKENDKKINDRDFPYSNLRKAYSRMYKVYQGVDEITNNEDLRRYNRQADYVLDMQNAFLATMRGPNAADCDNKLKRESNIENIKLIIGLK